MNAVVFRGVSLARGKRVILSGLDLAIPHGSFVGLLGPNGAGKTTLIRAMLGLLRPTAGTIEVFGRPPARGNPAIGAMPQSGSTLNGSCLSGRSFVAAAAGGVGWGMPRLTPEQRADVDRVLDLVNAAAYADRPLGTLSGGERQRLLLAQALLGAPRLLLLDEPLASLDPRAQAETVALVGHVARQLGIAVLFSAHDLATLLPSIDRVLYLGGGQGVLGTVDDVVNSATLSRLYGVPIEIVRAQGHVFAVAGQGVHVRL